MSDTETETKREITYYDTDEVGTAVSTFNQMLNGTPMRQAKQTIRQIINSNIAVIDKLLEMGYTVAEIQKQLEDQNIVASVNTLRSYITAAPRKDANGKVIKPNPKKNRVIDGTTTVKSVEPKTDGVQPKTQAVKPNAQDEHDNDDDIRGH